jgi:ATP-dependent Clp protease ATP-binding subunit ClpA
MFPPNWLSVRRRCTGARDLRNTIRRKVEDKIASLIVDN